MRGNAKTWALAALAACALSGALYTTTARAQEHAPDNGATPAEHQAAVAPDTATIEHELAQGDKHAEAEEGHGHAPKPINWFDFGNKEQPPYGAQLINFAALLGIFYFFGKKPIAEGLKARRAAVAKEIEEAQRMRAEAEERAKKYQAQLEHLEEELATTRMSLVEAGKGERDRIIKEAEEKAERMARDAKELLEQEAKQLQQELVRETVEIAMQAAEDMLKQRLTPADQERLADEYLAQLAASAAQKPVGGAS